MGLTEDVPLLRLFTDALEVVDGVALFGGIPLNGVGVAQDSSGRCELLLYVDGLVVGPFVEPLLDSDQSLLVFEDESQTILVEDPTGLVRFKGELFTGFAAEPHPSDGRHLGSLLGFVDGVCSDEVVAWYPSGRLSTYQRFEPGEGVYSLNSFFRWYADGSLEASRFRMDFPGDTARYWTDVTFDESGRLTHVAIDQWDGIDELVPDVRALARGPVFLSFEELAGFRTGQRLRLGPVNTSELGFDYLHAEGAMEDLEEIECDVSTSRVLQLTKLPRLRRIRFYHGAPDADSLEPLSAWKTAKPGRVVDLPG